MASIWSNNRYRQKQYQPMGVDEQVPLIYAGVNGFLDKIPVNRIGQFETGMFG